MEWTILSFLRREMVKKGASKDELDVLKECEKKISNLYLKYGKVIEARSLKETGHTVAEIQEKLKLDTVEVRPLESEEFKSELKKLGYYIPDVEAMARNEWNKMKEAANE